MTKQYEPVSCSFHSELELLSMHKTPVEISMHHDTGQTPCFTGKITDIFARNGEEFLELVSENLLIHQIRLDNIKSIKRR